MFDVYKKDFIKKVGIDVLVDKYIIEDKEAISNIEAKIKEKERILNKLRERHIEVNDEDDLDAKHDIGTHILKVEDDIKELKEKLKKSKSLFQKVKEKFKKE